MRNMLSALSNTMASRSKEDFSLRNEGDKARDRGDWSEAAKFYASHLEAVPNDFAIWVQLGHSLKNRGNSPKR